MVKINSSWCLAQSYYFFSSSLTCDFLVGTALTRLNINTLHKSKWFDFALFYFFFLTLQVTCLRWEKESLPFVPRLSSSYQVLSVISNYISNIQYSKSCLEAYELGMITYYMSPQNINIHKYMKKMMLSWGWKLCSGVFLFAPKAGCEWGLIAWSLGKKNLNYLQLNS